MATSHQVTVGSLLYTVVDDCTTTYWAVITGKVVDEILGDLYAPDLSVHTGRADLLSKTTVGGLFAVTGYPEQSFPHHDTVPYNVNLTFKASGFRDFNLLQSVPVASPFPVVLTAPVQLRRLPVRIQGRVVNDLTRAPIPGITVLSVDNPATPPPVHAMALRSPLYFDHPNNTQVQLVNLTPLGSSNLAADVSSGATVLSLNSLGGLGIGSVIQLSLASGVVMEYGVVVGLTPGTPNLATLAYPLTRMYPKSASTIRFFNATPVAPLAHLATDANSGDGVLIADQLLSGSTLVVDTGASAEYHEIGAMTDTDGYYSLDGIGRVPEIFLFAKQGALQVTLPWFIEYDRPINLVDLRLS